MDIAWLSDDQINRFLLNRRNFANYTQMRIIRDERLDAAQIAEIINTLIQDQKDLFDLANAEINRLKEKLELAGIEAG